MTIQHQIVADLRDVKTIRLNCKCGASISFDPDKELMLPPKCHSCHEDWPRQNADGNGYAMITEFARMIKEIRRAKEIVTVALELELPMEEAKGR
jgi:hypothetical protein